VTKVICDHNLPKVCRLATVRATLGEVHAKRRGWQGVHAKQLDGPGSDRARERVRRRMYNRTTSPVIRGFPCSDAPSSSLVLGDDKRLDCMLGNPIRCRTSDEARLLPIALFAKVP